MPRLLYQGHASFRLTADDGRVVYVDPFAGKGYEVPADLILVTHQHSDHNKVKLCTRKPDCQLITNFEALAGDRHNSFDIGGILIQAVEACNSHHDPKKCVGYIITMAGVKIYFSGDTSMTEQMKGFSTLSLDYAIFPGDGFANMKIKEAAECARLVGAKHNIICHLQPGMLFNKRKAEKWDAPNKLIITPAEEIELD
ncbi:MAG: MBL fold metallo-hydrolase [Coriobacteriales bacterium]|jgi:L-ascorbate metabolism protein UlaG (beta-lactamase superfamily)|nr:MBL fold metallo-hydrolase [Coriobacteriales bacterium]